MTVSIIFALIAFVGWAVGDIFGTIGARKLGALSMTTWSYLLRVLIFALYIPFGWHLLAGYTPKLLLLNIILGAILTAGFFVFNQALRIANPAIVITIVAPYTALIVIFSILFLHETVDLLQAITIIGIIVGIILASLDLPAFKEGKKLLSRGVVLALAAMVSFGIYFTFVKVLIRHVGIFWPNYVSFMLILPILAYLKVKRTSVTTPRKSNGLLPLLGAVLLTGAAEFSFNFAISKGNSAIVAPIAGANSALFVILAFLIFKEPVTQIQKMGIVLALAGVIILSAFSG